MVEIHEPMRILFAIDSTAEAMMQIIGNNPAIARLTDAEWVQLAAFDPGAEGTKIFHRGQFIAFHAKFRELAVAPSSDKWTPGKRESLGFASIKLTRTSPLPQWRGTQQDVERSNRRAAPLSLRTTCTYRSRIFLSKTPMSFKGAQA